MINPEDIKEIASGYTLSVPMAKKDCFAYNGTTCKCLTRLYCAKENCGFYKTKAQKKIDDWSTAVRLKSLGWVVGADCEWEPPVKGRGIT